MRKRRLVPLAAITMLLLIPAAAEAKTAPYIGFGTKAERMGVGFFLKDRQALKRLSFRDIPMRCGGGRRYRIDGRRFGKTIRLDSSNRFRARGAGSFPTGREVARVKGKVRVKRGRARGVLRVTARLDGGATCRSGKQPWRARRF